MAAGRRRPALTGVQVTLDDLLGLRFAHRQAESPRSRPRSLRAGVRLSRQRGRGVDFSEVRPYQPGDDVRTIEWRVTARKNRVHTKVFREERERPVLVVVDQTQSLYFGSRLRLKSVAAAELGARLAWRALAAGDRVGGLVIGNAAVHAHKPKRSVKAVARLMADLAMQNQSLQRDSRLAEGRHYADGLLSIRRLAPTGLQIWLVSDFLTAPEAWQDAVRALAWRNNLTLLALADPLEQHLPPPGRYAVTDGRSRLQFHAGSASLRRAYSARFEARQQALASLCATHAVRHLRLASDNADTYLPPA